MGSLPGKDSGLTARGKEARERSQCILVGIVRAMRILRPEAAESSLLAAPIPCRAIIVPMGTGTQRTIFCAVDVPLDIRCGEGHALSAPTRTEAQFFCG